MIAIYLIWGFPLLRRLWRFPLLRPLLRTMHWILNHALSAYLFDSALLEPYDDSDSANGGHTEWDANSKTGFGTCAKA
jgi:hypothetical protein